uniref:Guanylate cyclase domain-containing protein n=1 Tax=Plectus sambesii TaxID=2011161 RepID=A0A914W1L8_9BILA
MPTHNYSFVPSRPTSIRIQLQATQVLKMSILVAPPLIAVALLATVSLIASVDRRSEAMVLLSNLRRAEFVRALLTALQRERGTTCIHLERNRLHSTTFSDQLENYRKETDEIFAQWISDDDGDTNANKRKAIEKMELLSYRKKADSGNFLCNELIKWYNSLNHRLLASVISQQGVDKAQTTIHGFSAYHNILLAKDLIGITRALGGMYFTQASMEDGAAVQFSEAVGGAAVLLDLIGLEMPPAAQFYRELENKYAELMEQIQSARHTIESNGVKERNSDEESALVWWEKMTQYVDDVISPTEQFITETLLHRLENQKACANKRLTLTLLIAMITLILCPTMTVAYLLHTQGLQRANRIFGQELQLSTEQISSQKQISEQLLSNYIPKNLKPISTLALTMQFEARVFAAVTICSCDIMGFDRLIEVATPEQTVRLLNVLHSRLERIASRHDCYKFDHAVDSSATFVSGLPVANSSHSETVVRLALDIMELTESFYIPFLIDQTLVMQIGIHTGPVCTGVMGNKIPVYTILGKTIKTARLMQKSAQGMRIHISNATFEHLSKRQPGEFEYESSEAIRINDMNRPEVGTTPTYNLLGCSSEKYRANSHIIGAGVDNNWYWQHDYDRTQPCKQRHSKSKKEMEFTREIETTSI